MCVASKPAFTIAYNPNAAFQLVDSYQYLGAILTSNISWNERVGTRFLTPIARLVISNVTSF